MKRRDVLKGLAGTAALCALPQGAFAATGRAYTSTNFGLVLGGAFMGMLRSASGGRARGEVVAEAANGGRLPKHLGAVAYDDIAIEFGTGMEKPVYDWIATTLSGKSERKDGAIVAFDATGAVRSSLEFSQAHIAQVGLPALDAASKEPALLSLKLAPQRTSVSSKGDGVKAGAPPKGAQLLSSNFRLSIAGLEAATTKVSKIEPLVASIAVAGRTDPEGRAGIKKAVGLDLPNLVFSVAETGAEPLNTWLNDFVIKGNNGQEAEKTGTLELLGPDLKKAIITVQFSGLGLFRLEDEEAASADAIRKLRASLYCEEMRFSYAGA